MLVDILGDLFNVDQMRRVERAAPSPKGQLRSQVTWADGSTEIVLTAIDRFGAVCGKYIRAAEGYSVIVASEERGVVCFFEPVPVIAFRVSGVDEYAVTPVTVEGEPPDGNTYAVVLPDGRCFDGGERFMTTVDEWKASGEKRAAEIEANRKA